ncbi:hypothetical protein MP213Fo_04580 [Pseudochrobactrum sp. MP213Fo]
MTRLSDTTQASHSAPVNEDRAALAQGGGE